MILKNNPIMSNAFYKVPVAKNEPVLSYAPGSKERKEVQDAIKSMKSKSADIPMYIGSERVKSKKKVATHSPHDREHTIGH